MDNYILAELGVEKAAKILEIDAPQVAFFNNEYANSRNINSIFLKDKYLIGFNNSWINDADSLEVFVACFHETRHAFQWKCINGENSAKKSVDSDTVLMWKKEMNNYYQPTSSTIPEAEYINQSIEIDAIAFAHYQMDKFFKIKTIIPNKIYNSVQHILEQYRRNYNV